MMTGLGWAKHPMLKRMNQIREDKPITLLYGSRSWIDKSSWDLLKEARKSSSVNVQVISGAGHHVFADKPELFNKYVNEACEQSDAAIHLTTRGQTVLASGKTKYLFCVLFYFINCIIFLARNDATESEQEQDVQNVNDESEEAIKT